MRFRLAALFLLLPTLAGAAPWAIDPGTEVSVDVRWRGGTVTVHFPQLAGTIDFDADHPERARATITVSARAAATGLPPVDALVRSEGYLDTAHFPDITFRLERLERLSASTAAISGQITLRGVTQPIDFDATVIRYGPASDNSGRFEAGFDLSGEIDRTRFGSMGGVPDVAAELPIRIRLLMSSR
jgi:polyisoprenoid-binding protein YceI